MKPPPDPRVFIFINWKFVVYFFEEGLMKNHLIGAIQSWPLKFFHLLYTISLIVIMRKKTPFSVFMDKKEHKYREHK